MWYTIQVDTISGWVNYENTIYTTLEQAQDNEEWLSENHRASNFRIIKCDVYGNQK